MTIPVLLFALPSVFIGNPLNVFFVLWWGLGAYGIHSGIFAVIAFGKPNYVLHTAQKVGISLGILSFMPLIPLTLKGEIALGTASACIVSLAILGLVPAIMLLLLSFRKNIDKTMELTAHGAAVSREAKYD